MVSTRDSNRAKPAGTYRNYVDFGSASSGPSEAGDDSSGDSSSANEGGNAAAGPSRRAGKKATGVKGKGKAKEKGAKGKKRNPTLDIRSESSGESFHGSEEDDEEFEEEGDRSEDSGGPGEEDDDDDIVDFDADGRPSRSSKRVKTGRGGLTVVRRRDAIDADEDVLMEAEDVVESPAPGVKEKRRPPTYPINPPYMDINPNFSGSNAYRILQVSLPIRPMRNTHLTAPPHLSRLSSISHTPGGFEPESTSSATTAITALPQSRSWKDVERVHQYLAEAVVVEHHWKHWEGGEWYPECYKSLRSEDSEAGPSVPAVKEGEMEKPTGKGKGKAAGGTTAGKKTKAPAKGKKGAAVAAPLEVDVMEEQVKVTGQPTEVQLDSTLIDIGLGGVGRDVPPGGYAYSGADTADFDALFGQDASPLRCMVDTAEGIKEISMLPPLTAMVQGDGKRSRVKVLINAGKCIQKLGWCPMSEARSAQRGFKQYLAVLVPLTELPRSSDSPDPTRSILQIWSFQGHDKPHEEVMNVDEVETSDKEEEDSEVGEGPEGGPKQKDPSPMLWGGLEDCTATCEAVIVIEDAWTDFKWMPLGCCDDYAANGSSKIGIIAATCADGEVKFYSITDGLLAAADEHPYGLRTLSPILTIPNDDGSPLCMSWGSGSTLAVGFTHGVIRTWHDVPAMLRNGVPAYPSTSIIAHAGPINSVAYLRMPLRNASGDQVLDQQPVYVLSVGFDGLTILSDTRDPELCAMTGTATRTTNRVFWFPYGDAALLTEGDHSVAFFRVRRAGAFGMTRVMSHDGIVMTIAGSDFHGTLASGATDGTMRWTNGIRGSIRTSKQRILAQTIYKLDYDVKEDRYRLVEDFLPLITDREPKDGMPGKRQRAEGSATMHDPRLSVNSIDWQTGGGIGRAGLCASGTGCGLGRVDWLCGDKA